jgi:uncharacterized protein YodC (DUF2158 family)
MENFKIGDIVYLKGGSLPMTIDDIRPNGKIFVVWYDDKGEHHTAHPSEALTKENPYQMPTDPPPLKIGF